VERGLEPGYPSGCCITGAEKLWPHQRDRVVRAFGSPVHERYGSRDVGLVGLQLEPWTSTAYELDWANLLVEPASSDGVADILVTKLHADVHPMIRYRIGDMGHFSPDARPGHPAFRLQEVIGRRVDRLRRADGGWFHGLSVPHLMKDFPVRDFQVVQAQNGDIDILLVPGRDYDSSHGEGIARIIRNNVGPLAVTVRLVEEIPRIGAAKWRPVISHVAGEAPS
jgi:phenylacetate-coenzyme A ligase PaaK-like adenylate-forming protein